MPLYLECEARGYPYPHITWVHNQTVLQHNTKATKADTNLLRRNSTKSYNGNYTCYAENELGSDNYTADVNVIGKFVGKWNKECIN